MTVTESRDRPGHRIRTRITDTDTRSRTRTFVTLDRDGEAVSVRRTAFPHLPAVAGREPLRAAREVVSREGDVRPRRPLRSERGRGHRQVFAFIVVCTSRVRLAYALAFARPPVSAPADRERRARHHAERWAAPRPGARVTATPRRAFASVDIASTIRATAVRACARARSTKRSAPTARSSCWAASPPASTSTSSRRCSAGGSVPDRRSSGRGDMSRGGLLLRCVRSGEELDYVPVSRRGSARTASAAYSKPIR